MMKRITSLFVLIGLLTSLSLIQSQAADEDAAARFYFGVDLSYVNEMDDCGAVYRENSIERDAYELFAERGANLVRARLWHQPDWTEYSTLDDVKRTFRRAESAGMATLLDIHYSDTWADAGTQQIPAAWKAFDDAELEDAVYDYTIAVLTELADEDLIPAFVQVGNETNSGILKRGGSQNWTRDAHLFNAGIRAVRDFSTETGQPIQVMLHVAQPENTMWWFSEAEAVGLTDFDVIGVSYYPQWSTYSIGDMGAQVTALRQRFGKEVMILETGYGWTREMVAESADNVLNQGLRGYPFSLEGQYRFMHDLTQSLISNGAIGMVYWEPAWVSTPCLTRWGQGSHWENATFFDFRNDNELLDSVNYLNDAYIYPAVPADGIVEAEYGAPLVEDGSGDDVLNGFAALDLTALYVRSDGEMLSLALTIAGDIYSREGSYLVYFDTTHDEQGANIDVGRRPIITADEFRPEYRLDVTLLAEGDGNRASYVLSAWNGSDDWETISYTGGAAIVSGDDGTVIELQMPVSLIGSPERVYLAAVSTDRGRARGASDVLGTERLPEIAEDEDLVLEAFFEFVLP